MQAPTQIPSRIWPLVGLFVTGLLLAGALGGITNSLSGWVGPVYVVAIIQPQNMDDVWWARIAEGVAEGVLRGFVLCAVFTTGVAIISRGDCPMQLSLRYLFGIFGAISVGWMVGGLLCMSASLFYPPFYRTFFFGMPDDLSDVMRYSWASGSMWGAQLGGIISTLVALGLFRRQWKGNAS